MAKGTSRVGKNDLVGTVAGTTELTKENTKKVVNAVLEGIFSVLKQTGQLQLTKFGTFSVRKTKGRPVNLSCGSASTNTSGRAR
jgi:nucleoid DNA-binding protein